MITAEKFSQKGTVCKMNENIIKHLSDIDVKENLRITAAVRNAARAFLAERAFIEIDTPILMPRTGERYNATFDITLEDHAAMLADSPQLFKMLLCMAGYQKYFQFAHCFRVTTNENKLHTRLSEFVQLDIEVKNTCLEALTELAEKLISEICKALSKAVSFTQMNGLSCRAEYGDEMSPDLRKDRNNGEISVVIVKNMPLTNDGKVPCHHIFAMPSDPDFYFSGTKPLNELTTESFDIIMNGIEIGGGDMRIPNRELQLKMMRIFNVDETRYGNYLELLGERGNNGGFAIGLERLIMALTGAENVRDVTAFPEYYKRGVN